MTELRKCPFCGGEAETYPSYFNEWYVCCVECSCVLGAFENKEKAIEAWNKRVPPTSKDIEEYIEKTHKENMELVAKLKRKHEVESSCDTCAMYYPDDGCMAGLAEEVQE